VGPALTGNGDALRRALIREQWTWYGYTSGSPVQARAYSSQDKEALGRLGWGQAQGGAKRRRWVSPPPLQCLGQTNGYVKVFGAQRGDCMQQQQTMRG
jgi:hypothetical protein